MIGKGAKAVEPNRTGEKKGNEDDEATENRYRQEADKQNKEPGKKGEAPKKRDKQKKKDAEKEKEEEANKQQQ